MPPENSENRYGVQFESGSGPLTFTSRKATRVQLGGTFGGPGDYRHTRRAITSGCHSCEGQGATNGLHQ